MEGFDRVDQDFPVNAPRPAWFLVELAFVKLSLG